MIGKLVAKSKIFKIYERSVVFPNQTVRLYEYASLYDDTLESVMVVGVKNGILILTEEFLHALDKKGLIFPGGKVDPNESFEQAAIREFNEETGLLAKRATKLGLLDIHPKYFYGRTHVFLIEDWSEEQAYHGDEEESAIQVFELDYNAVKQKIQDGTISDSRTIAALYFALPSIKTA